MEITSRQSKETAIIHFRPYKKVGKDFMNISGKFIKLDSVWSVYLLLLIDRFMTRDLWYPVYVLVLLTRT